MVEEIIAKVRLDNGELQADVQDAKKIVDKGITEIEKNSIDLKVDAKSTESLRTQLRKATLEVAELTLKFGATSKEVANASIKAGLLKDSLKDAQDSIAAFNPDAKFRALTGSLQGVVGGFSAVQGAIGAFGVKSEEVEQALLKVNSAMALSQGLQSVGESVDSFKNLGAVIKSSTVFQTLYNFVMGEKVAVQQADIATTVASTAATRAQAAATTTATVATTAFATAGKILRAALVATGIGALVVGLAAVINNFDSISAWIRSSPLGNFANQVGNLVEKFTDFIGVTSEAERASNRLAKANSTANKQIENRIKLLKAQGGSEKEIATLQKQAIQNDINVLNSKKKLSDEEKQTRENLKNDLLVVDAEYNKKVQDDNEKANEKTRAANEKAAEEERKDREKSNEMLNTLRNNNTLDAIKDSEQRALKQLEIEDKRQRDEIAALKISNEQKAELYKELDIKLEQGRADIITKQREKDFEFEINARSKFNAIVNEKELQDLADKNKDKKDLLQAGFDDLDEFIQAEDKLKKEASDKEKARQKDLIDKQKQALNDLVDFAQKGILLQLGLNPQDVERVKGSLINVLDTFKATEDKIQLEGEEGQKARLARIQATTEVIANGLTTISNGLFAADAQRRQQELASLSAQQEEELRLAGDNEQKKDLIRQKYALKEREIKRRQAEADKRKAIFDAIVGTAVAVIRALPNFVLAAIAGALGAAQIALIASQPIPKFAKGGAVPSSDINGMISGKPHASGGVLIEAEGNEFITRRSQAMKGDNLGLLEAINMSDSERDAYINRHYVMPALQAKESQAAQNYRSSIIEAENNLIARVSSSTLKSIDRRLVETNQSIKGLAKKDYTW
jgi:hypothetical protein